MRMDERMRAPRPDAVSVPMIGMMVLLVIVAMVITPAVGGPRLAEARTATPVMRGPLTVGVDRDGRVWIPGAPVPGPMSESRLAARLRDDYALRGDRTGVLHLVADRWAPYRHVQAVLRAAAQAGVREVELIVECPPGRESLGDRCHRWWYAGPNRPDGEQDAVSAPK
jgi:biopolymer transport protein ExbD